MPVLTSAPREILYRMLCNTAPIINSLLSRGSRWTLRNLRELLQVRRQDPLVNPARHLERIVDGTPRMFFVCAHETGQFLNRYALYLGASQSDWGALTLSRSFGGQIEIGKCAITPIELGKHSQNFSVSKAASIYRLASERIAHTEPGYRQYNACAEAHTFWDIHERLGRRSMANSTCSSAATVVEPHGLGIYGGMYI